MKHLSRLLLCLCLSCGVPATAAAAQEPPVTVTSLVQQGNEHLWGGRSLQALASFDQALAFEPAHPGARFNRGCALALLGRYQEALDVFAALADVEPRPYSAFCHFNIGGICVKQGMMLREADWFTRGAAAFQAASEHLPHFVLAIDDARFARLFGQSLDHINQAIFSVSANGMPPDSAIALTPQDMSAAQGSAYFFEGSTPPMLYFYRSPSTEYLLCTSSLDPRNPLDVPEDVRACLEPAAGRMASAPANRLTQTARWSAHVLLCAYYKGQGNAPQYVAHAETMLRTGIKPGYALSILLTHAMNANDCVSATRYATDGLRLSLAPEDASVCRRIIERCAAPTATAPTAVPSAEEAW